MTTHEQQVKKTNALLAINSSGTMVLIDELTTFTRVQLPDLSWSDWEEAFPQWQYELVPLQANKVCDTLISSTGEVFRLITAY